VTATTTHQRLHRSKPVMIVAFIWLAFSIALLRPVT
jgi:hypothetical protein